MERHIAGTEPYPWPYDGRITPDSLALVIVGAQRWWIGCTEGVTAALDAIGRLRVACRAVGVPVLIVSHTAPTAPAAARPPWLPLAGSEAAERVLELERGDLVLPAAGLDACATGTLDTTLRRMGIDHLLVAGLGLEGPVHSTLRGANDRGYECLLVADACSSDGARTRAGAVSSVLMSGGIFGAVGSTAAVLTAVAGLADDSANTPADPEVIP